MVVAERVRLRGLMAVLAVLIALPGLASLAAAAPTPTQGATAVEPAVEPAQIVILVDQSRSLTDDDLRRERDAASLIAQSEFSPRSVVTVIGFGSDEGGVGPTDLVCPATVVAGAAERQRLSDCVQGLRIREPGRGDDTDHAAALEQALASFTPAPVGPRVVFLLTDGRLDVGDTQRYGTGKTLDQRNQAAEDRLVTLLRTAAEQQVQIWPLGFGDVDRDALTRFARDAAQSACGPGAPAPEATVVESSADVDGAIVAAYGASRCAGTGDVTSTQIHPGETVPVPVEIPSIATDGSITVVKRNPGTGVQYVDPDGRVVPKAGSFEGSTFEVSGENGPVEALRIVDPKPGTWTVRLTAQAGDPPQDVTTAVTWQGAVQAILLPNPQSIQAGRPLTVSLSLRTRRGPVTDPAQLARLSFAAVLDPGAGAPVPIGLADDGREPDPAAGDGTYTGQVVVPADAAGTVTVRGSVRGIGISGDEPSAGVQVTSGPPPLLVAATLPNINDSVHPGGTVTGQVTVTNNSAVPRRVLLRIAQDVDSGIAVAEGSAVREVAAAGNTSFEAVLALPADAAIGPAGGVVEIVDADDPATVLGAFPFTVRVVEPVPWLLYGAVVAAVLAVLAVVVVAVRRHQARVLTGVTVTVVSGSFDTRQVVPRGATRFRFSVVAPAGAPPQIQISDGAGGYRLTRRGERLTLRTPRGEVPTRFDTPVEVDDGVSIRVKRPFTAGPIGHRSAVPAVTTTGAEPHTGSAPRDADLD